MGSTTGLVRGSIVNEWLDFGLVSEIPGVRATGLGRREMGKFGRFRRKKGGFGEKMTGFDFFEETSGVFLV